MAQENIYLKLTKDEVETIKIALRSQYEGGDNLNIDGTENDDLILKICLQEDAICRPYVVTGVHDTGLQYVPKRLVVMAENADCAIEYAKEKLEKTSEDVFKIKPEDVHEMTDDEIAVEVL